MKGKLIIIEGLDGSGKKTQTQLLYEHIRRATEKIRYISFPDYESPSSSLVKMYLNSEFGSDPMCVNPYAASSFFAVDRYASYKQTWSELYQDGYTILADRYTTSNAIYQMAKFPKNLWKGYLNWLYDYEYKKLELPAPDRVIFLDVPVDTSQELMEKRYLGDVQKKDLHENNVNFLKKCKIVSQYIAEIDSWNVIKCSENGKIKGKNEIHKMILDTLFGDIA